MMKLFNYKFLRNCFLAFIAATVFTGCEKDDEVITETENLDTKITANAELSLFQYALKKSKINTFTQGGGPFTIFAPTNAAFTAAGIANEAAINALDTNLLVQIMTYHIQANARSYVEIPLGPNATMSTQSGYTQYASRYLGSSASAFINGAKITTADVKASNGIMHVIDRVLVPPYFNALVNITANPDYSLMVQAITKTATTATFTGGTSSFFAIPNSVMTAAGYDATAIANLTAPQITLLGNILKYHVVPQRIFSPDFKAGNLKTVQGSNVVISFTGNTINVKGATNATAFQLTSGNFACSNGVLYSINGLLKY